MTELLKLSGEISYEGGEYVLVRCHAIGSTLNPNGMLNDFLEEPILLALPKDRVERIFDWVKEQIPEEDEEGGE